MRVHPTELPALFREFEASLRESQEAIRDQLKQVERAAPESVDQVPVNGFIYLCVEHEDGDQAEMRAMQFNLSPKNLVPMLAGFLYAHFDEEEIESFIEFLRTERDAFKTQTTHPFDKESNYEH